jgi:spore coat protein U-like protein
MANGANLLSYGLYTDGARTSLWGDGIDASSATISGTGSGAAQENIIYGRVASGQTSLPAGSYDDTVAVTVTY